MTDEPRRHPFRILNPDAHSPEFAGQCALTVMAKAPAPGRVKTRLSPPLTPHQAAELNAAFLRDTLTNLGAAAAQTQARCGVSYTPVGEEAAFAGILPDDTLLIPQRGDSFGERLLATAEDLFGCGFSAVCLIDSDSPTVPTEAFIECVRTLLDSEATGRVTLGRSDDGGYYLIGLTAPHTRLFADIAWSTDAVSDQTEERAAELGLDLHRLVTWYDVDDRHSLARLQAELRGDAGTPQGYDAAHTRAYLAQLPAAAENLHDAG